MADSAIVVVGLGPAGPELVTAQTLELIAATPTRFARTDRHPSVTVLGEHRSFDDLYKNAEVIDDVYTGIVDALVRAARDHGRVLYAVPGSPAVAERTVELLARRDDVAVEIHAAMSFIDLAWTRLGIDPMAVGPRLVDGHRFAVEAAGERGPLLVCQCDTRDVLSDIKLAVDDPPDSPVAVMSRLGRSDEQIVWVPWDELDRTVEPDHLTSVWIPELASPVASELVAFDKLVADLRDGCPWDREQTHGSLRRYLIEETYEVLEAIDGLDPDDPDTDDALCEELGDLLFQVVFHARIAAQEGRFDLADVARTVHEKLHARHPHVFGDVEVASLDELTRSWERAKRAEKGRASVMDGIPAALPALLYAAKVLKKSRLIGGEGSSVPTDDGGTRSVSEALDRFSAEESSEGLGELVLAVVSLATERGIDPEDATRRAAGRIEADARRREDGTSAS